MSIREGFGKYWLAGIIFSMVFGAITTGLNFFSTNVASYLMNILPGIVEALLLLVEGCRYSYSTWIVGDCWCGFTWNL
jgi:ABC-type Fe3+-siderophore transport system permease subunit